MKKNECAVGRRLQSYENVESRDTAPLNLHFVLINWMPHHNTTLRRCQSCR